MGEVKDKRILKEIAKRFAKSVLLNSESMVHFGDSLLTNEEITFVQEELMAIANKITDKPVCFSTNDLVEEYYETDK